MVSIIVPVFNTCFKDLTASVNSIIGQTFSQFEVILVDDGSDVSYAAQLDELATRDPRIRVFHRKNSGVSASRNFGVSKAKGQYILFSDADDLMTPWLLETGMDAIEREHCDVILGKILTTAQRPDSYPVRSAQPVVEILDDDSKKKEMTCHIFAKTCKRWQRDGDGWEFNGEGCWAHLMKREVAEAIPFLTDISVGEDTIWALSVLNDAHGFRMGLLHEKWYYYIQNEYSVLNKYSPRIAEQLTGPVKILDPIYGTSNGMLFAAYTDWLLMKMRHICYRAYLAEENKEPMRRKQKELAGIFGSEPWTSVLGRANRQPLKKRIKFNLYRFNLMLLIYRIQKYTRKEISRLEEHDENKN